MREPVWIKVNEEPHAIALAQELVGMPGLDVHQTSEGWEVRVEGLNGDRGLVRILDSVRTALAGDTSASALVVLDGREYRMRGE